MGLWVTKQLKDLPPMIYEWATSRSWARAFARIDGAHRRLSAAVSLADGYGALVKRYPMIAEMAERFASPPVRHSGTLVGNIANGSPIGDSMPILIALGASVTLRGEGLRRT